MHAAQKIEVDSHAAGGNLPTFRDLFREHAPFVMRSLRYLGVPDGSVHDASQEVFLVIHRRLADFEGRSSMRTWIYGICLRVARSQGRKAHRRYEKPSEAPPERAVSASQQEMVERRQIRQRLGQALDAIDEKKRDVFVLHAIEEIPMVEVAEIVGCPLPTAYSRHKAARAELKKFLRRQAAVWGKQ